MVSSAFPLYRWIWCFHFLVGMTIPWNLYSTVVLFSFFSLDSVVELLVGALRCKWSNQSLYQRTPQSTCRKTVTKIKKTLLLKGQPLTDIAADEWFILCLNRMVFHSVLCRIRKIKQYFIFALIHMQRAMAEIFICIPVRKKG